MNATAQVATPETTIKETPPAFQRSKATVTAPADSQIVVVTDPRYLKRTSATVETPKNKE